MTQESPFEGGLIEGGEEPCYLHLIDERGDLETRADVEFLLRDFYRQVVMDDLLGPIFEAAVADWNAHIETLTDFWVWQLFGVRGYTGNPLVAHRPVYERMPFGAEHYRRWLDLFAETVDLDYAGPVAEAAKQRAVKMAGALRRLLDGADPAAEPLRAADPDPAAEPPRAVGPMRVTLRR